VFTLVRILTLRLGTPSNVNFKYIEPMRKAAARQNTADQYAYVTYAIACLIDF